jgi:hypothetical protein
MVCWVFRLIMGALLLEIVLVYGLLRRHDIQLLMEYTRPCLVLVRGIIAAVISIYKRLMTLH